ncbi:DUF6169 family protein [Chitinophaga sp. GbtcB8]|uniref:DUF6169 family protein n=1 Tax=Chitinophaga sp. GbtcB8 TaxID=2824753 RepID=UPI001C302234|nr:DUF6169 family protein [Chitinophaga sp. GbtcB8]
MLTPYEFLPLITPIEVNVTYVFHTKYGHKYGVTFIEATKITELLDEYPVISNAIYVTLDILQPGGSLYFDCRIGITVVEIIKHYLANVDMRCLLVYNCAIDEGKQVKRNDKFDRWFNHFAQDYKFEKIDREILEPQEDKYIPTFISFLFSSIHPRKVQILQELEMLSQLLGTDKLG